MDFNIGCVGRCYFTRIIDNCTPVGHVHHVELLLDDTTINYLDFVLAQAVKKCFDLRKGDMNAESRCFYEANFKFAGELYSFIHNVQLDLREDFPRYKEKRTVHFEVSKNVRK